MSADDEAPQFRPSRYRYFGDHLITAISDEETVPVVDEYSNQAIGATSHKLDVWIRAVPVAGQTLIIKSRHDPDADRMDLEDYRSNIVPRTT